MKKKVKAPKPMSGYKEPIFPRNKFFGFDDNECSYGALMIHGCPHPSPPDQTPCPNSSSPCDAAAEPGNCAPAAPNLQGPPCHMPGSPR